MSTITVSCTNIIGRIKPMHAVNNGPMKPSSVEQTRGNFEAFKAAKIPYVRNHDASFCASYGGEHTVDVHAIFPDFTKNPYDPESYDFTLTDEYLSTITDAGSEVFYRLGSKIEHWPKKYGTIVPPDFKKWAVICEHIIRHYNKGWANGFHFGITYWEIWNEPDGKKSNGDQPNWSGTPQDYYELYEIAATHLKSRFPDLKIGGPAVSSLVQRWTDDFLAYLIRDGKRVPLDFFSWHSYPSDPHIIAERARYARAKLDFYGYTETESHLNEYNYLINFTTRFVESIENIIRERGAAFTAAAMCVGQTEALDMMMYYDARVSTVFNGMFDFYTLRPLKGYYPFVYFSELYALENAVEICSDSDDVYAAAAATEDDCAVMAVYYPKEGEEVRSVTLHTGRPGRYLIRTTDRDVTDSASYIDTADGTLILQMQANSIILAKRADGE